MAVFTTDTEPSSPAVNDIWLMTNGFRRFWDGFFWQRFTPAGTTTENSILPPQGTGDRHLAKRTSSNFDAIWVDPTEGILYRHEQVSADDKWQIQHNLRQQIIEVVAYSPGNTLNALDQPDWTLTPTDQTMLIPEIEYVSNISCLLKFAHPVKGTALCRR